MKQASRLPIANIALLLVIAYLLWFLAPILLMDIDPNATAVSGIDSIFAAGFAEVVIVGVLLLLIGYLGWWKKVGLQKVQISGLKFIMLPFAYTLLLIAIAAFLAQSNEIPLNDIFEPQELALLLLISFLVGFNEEVIFRGFVFGGLLTKLSPLGAAIACALVFGLFHLVNLIGGQALDITVSQVLQASSMGFMYAALRLRLNSIWPLILLHGFWDFSVSLMQEASQLVNTEAVAQGGIHPLVSMPVLIYGIFVYWRWRVSCSRQLPMLAES